jgi:SAM-dependent methyltransferase
MKLRVEPICPLCRQQAQRLHQFRQYSVALCSGCDFAFNYYAADHSLLHLFADQYVDSVTSSGLLQKYVARRRFHTIESFPAGSLLEVGCGVGYFLRAASSKFDVVGLDNSESVVAKAREIAPRATVLCTESLPERRFDLICGFHVFEHITDPVAFAADVRGKLAPGGLFYIRIPNRDSPWSRMQGEKFFLEGHCSHFSPRSLRKALELAGFNHIDIATDSFAGRWLASLASPIIAAGSRAVRPVNRAYETSRRKTVGLRIKRAMLGTFQFSQLASDVVFRPLLAAMSRRGNGEELIALARD